MRFLFLHSSFPAQFFYLARYLGTCGHQVVFLTKSDEGGEISGIRRIVYKPARDPSRHTHPYLLGLEKAVLEGQAAFQTAWALKEQGFVPDVIIGHSGWGSTLYMKDLYPNVPFLGYFEWFYRAHGSDVGFGPNEKVGPDDECRIRTKNGPILLDLFGCDVGISPTYWQHSQFPVEYCQKIKVIHDGINTEICKPQPNRKLMLPQQNLDLSHAQEIVTYVGRGMEPYRGFPQFMHAVSLLQKRRPQCHVVIVGGDGVFYGTPPSQGDTWKNKMLNELSLDLNKIHFTGYLNRNDYLTVLQASTVHVYLTRPFVLSWSMLEAMACGCTLVASATPPVQEVVLDRVNGLLTDFFSPQQLAGRIEEALDDRQLRVALSHRARETVLDRYDLRKMLPLQISLLQDTIESCRRVKA
ncbi:MAG: glycosyltransferase [Veillonellaceae bacterium]|nr:glycosyltransferase [Veillonellaceae bacterium]